MEEEEPNADQKLLLRRSVQATLPAYDSEESEEREQVQEAEFEDREEDEDDEEEEESAGEQGEGSSTDVDEATGSVPVQQHTQSEAVVQQQQQQAQEQPQQQQPQQLQQPQQPQQRPQPDLPPAGVRFAESSIEEAERYLREAEEASLCHLRQAVEDRAAALAARKRRIDELTEAEEEAKQRRLAWERRAQELVQEAAIARATPPRREIEQSVVAATGVAAAGADLHLPTEELEQVMADVAEANAVAAAEAAAPLQGQARPLAPAVAAAVAATAGSIGRANDSMAKATTAATASRRGSLRMHAPSSREPSPPRGAPAAPAPAAASRRKALRALSPEEERIRAERALHGSAAEFIAAAAEGDKSLAISVADGSFSVPGDVGTTSASSVPSKVIKLQGDNDSGSASDSAASSPAKSKTAAGRKPVRMDWPSKLRTDIRGLCNPSSFMDKCAIPNFANRIYMEYLRMFGAPEKAPYGVLEQMQSVFVDRTTNAGLRKSIFFTFNELCGMLRTDRAHCNAKFFRHAGWLFLKAVEDAHLDADERHNYAVFVRGRGGRASHIWTSADTAEPRHLEDWRKRMERWCTSMETGAPL